MGSRYVQAPAGLRYSTNEITAVLDQRHLSTGDVPRWSSSERQRAYRDPVRSPRPCVGGSRYVQAPGRLHYSTNKITAVLDRRHLLGGRPATSLRWSSSERQRAYRDPVRRLGPWSVLALLGYPGGVQA